MAATGFILGSPSAEAQVILLAAESDTAIQTALSSIKKYMIPYYQTDDDQVILAEYLGKYGSAYCGAAAMWSELPSVINAGSTVKSYGTGAERTEFVDISKILQLCRYNELYFARKCKAADGQNTSQAILLTKPTIARGAKV